MTRDDQYTTVKQTVTYCKRDAFMINGKDWIPFSLIHAADEKKIRRTQMNSTLTFRLRERKANELGL